MYVWRRIYHPATGEYRRGEYVGYVTTRTMSGVDEGMYTNSEPPKVVAKPRLRLVRDLRELASDVTPLPEDQQPPGRRPPPCTCLMPCDST